MYQCPRGCKGKRNKAPLELNVEKGVGHCFICGLSFRFNVTSQTKRDVLQAIRQDREETPSADVGSIPFNIHRKFRERGVEPLPTIARYRAGWDGSRICWPIYQGEEEMTLYWRRAVYSLQTPKVLTDSGAHGLLGGHLLTTSNYICITEGDWKAVSIPLPWIGVGIGGTSLSKRQLNLLGLHHPSEVVVCLDGGVDTRRVRTSLTRAGIKNRKIQLPKDLGPDDVSMKERMRLLLEEVL